MQTNNIATQIQSRISMFLNFIWQPKYKATTILTLVEIGLFIHILQLDYPQQLQYSLSNSDLIGNALLGGALAGPGGISIVLGAIAGYFASTGNVAIETTEIIRVCLSFIVILAVAGGIPLWRNERELFLPVMLPLAMGFSVLIRYCW